MKTQWITAALATLALAGPATAQTHSNSVADYVSSMKVLMQGYEGNGRVIEGRPSEEGARPWQVGLASTLNLDKRDPESQYQAQFCGGSVMNSIWVLTAAHCVTDDAGSAMPPGDLAILYGNNDLTRARVALVEEIIVHETYNTESLVGDIAMVRLAEPLDLDADLVAAVETADAAIETEFSPPATTAIVSGWGIREDGTAPVVLYEVDIDIQPLAVCEQGLIDLYHRQFAEMLRSVAGRLKVSPEAAAEAFQVIVGAAADPVPDTMLCAGIATGERDSCNGDSGGPLVVEGLQGVVQVGIVSWGEVPLTAAGPCGNAQLYGYYTRVASYHDWINSTLTLP